MSELPIHVDLDLSPSAALALAQFTKRVTWKGMRECAVGDAEAYDIRAAIDTRLTPISYSTATPPRLFLDLARCTGAPARVKTEG
jgi:hypothetical protein